MVSEVRRTIPGTRWPEGDVAMEITEFLGLNVVVVGALIIVVLIYLVVLIRKRRRRKFLHRDD